MLSEYANAEVNRNSVALKIDPMESMTCGQNLERKIAEQKQRLALLENALLEMKGSGLYNIKISTLRDTMSY